MRIESIQELTKHVGYIKNMPITSAELMPKKLDWEKMDQDWIDRMAESNHFWFTGFKGDLLSHFILRERVAHVQEILKLRDRLLTFGGEQACMIAPEGDLEGMMTRGQLWYGDRIQKHEMISGQSHQNAAYLWHSNRDNQEAELYLATGYGLSEDGMWRQHSWLVGIDPELNNASVIIETTMPRIAYYGFVFNTVESEEFFRNLFER